MRKNLPDRYQFQFERDRAPRRISAASFFVAPLVVGTVAAIGLHATSPAWWPWLFPDDAAQLEREHQLVSELAECRVERDDLQSVPAVIVEIPVPEETPLLDVNFTVFQSTRITEPFSATVVTGWNYEDFHAESTPYEQYCYIGAAYENTQLTTHVARIEGDGEVDYLSATGEMLQIARRHCRWHRRSGEGA